MDKIKENGDNGDTKLQGLFLAVKTEQQCITTTTFAAKTKQQTSTTINTAAANEASLSSSSSAAVSDEIPVDLMAETDFQRTTKKKRMARQKRSSVSPLSFPFTLPMPTRVIDSTRLKYLFEKELKNSDVSPLRRMVLPKIRVENRKPHLDDDVVNGIRAAEQCLPSLDAKDGIYLIMDDMDGHHAWKFKFRFWPNNNSRMYVLENTGEFVNKHGLRKGDYIVLYQDYENHNYVIEAKKGTNASTAKLGSYTNSIAQSLEFDLNGLNWFTESLSKKMHGSGTPTSFVYETTFSISDTPFDFLSGSIASNNYSKVQPQQNFGSIEIFDDLF